jgi:hypothetical protein
MDFAQEIETLIRARYPILYVLSSEEARVQALLTGIAQKRQKRVFDWSVTTGLVPSGTSIQSQKHRASPTKDPLLALDQVIDQVEPAIFVFKDFHPFLSRANYAVVRKLKEIALQLKNSQKDDHHYFTRAGDSGRVGKGDHAARATRCRILTELSGLLDRIAEDVRQFPHVRIEVDAASRERLLQAALV